MVAPLDNMEHEGWPKEWEAAIKEADAKAAEEEEEELKRQRELEEEQERDRQEIERQEKERQEKEQKEKEQKEKERQEKEQKEQLEKEQAALAADSSEDQPPRAVALFDYEGHESGDLSFSQGQEVCVCVYVCV